MSQENRFPTKKVAAISAVVLILAVAIGAAVKFWPFGTSKNSNAYTAQSIASVDSKLPLMQSDIDNIFYTMDTDGTVTFYEYDGSALNQIKPTGSVEVAPQCSGVKVPATLYYVQRGDEMTGYGLYYPPKTGDAVMMYTYFFFNMRALPKGYPNEDNTQFLLLMDSDADDMYLQHKTYDESFFVQPFEKEIDKRTDFNHNQFVSQVNRMPSADGKYLDNFAVFTEDALAGAVNGNTLFFSGRKYMDQKDEHWDIYRRFGSSGAVRTTIYTDISYLYAFEDQSGGIHYMRQTENGFSVYCNDDLVKEFTGDYNTEYLRDGNYLLNKSTAVVTDLLTGKEWTLTGTDTTDAVLFRMNPSGERCVIGAMKNGNAKEQSMIFGDLKNNTFQATAGTNLFSAHNAGLGFLDDDRYFHNTSPAESGETYTGRIFSFDSVMSALQEQAGETAQ